MKKLVFAILLTISCFFANKLNAAGIIQVAAPLSVDNVVNTAQDGDIIELTTSGGSYVWVNQVTISIEKTITIRAAAGLAVRPTITYMGGAVSTNGFIRYSPSAGVTTKTLTFDGINFEASSNLGYFLSVSTPSANSNLNVSMNNCSVNHLNASLGRVFNYTSLGPAMYGNMNVTNSEFKSYGQSIINSSLLKTTPQNTTFTNCYFENSFVSTIHRIRLTATGYSSFTMDHCTFSNNGSPEISVVASTGTSLITNTIFVNTNTNNATPNSFGGTKPIYVNSDCGIFYTGMGVKSTLYPYSTAASTINPQIDASGYATASEYYSGSMDGYPIGRFNTNGFSTLVPTTITASTATLNGNVFSLGNNGLISSYGFCWNTTGSPTTSDASIDKGACSSTGAFNYNLASLTPGTKYYIRTYITNSSGTIYGNELSFTTAGLATVTTQATTSITSTTATLNGTVSSLSDTPVTSYGFCLNTTGTPTISDNKLDKGACSATGTYTYSATGLTPSAIYYVRSYATNSAGTAYGSQVSFTTTSGLGSLTTQAVSSILSTTATLNGTVSSLGDSPVTSYGFCINTSGTPTITDTKLDNGACSATGAFTYSATGLTPITTYYVRSFATNNSGTAYGSQESFTTTSGLAIITTQSATSVTATSAKLNGTITVRDFPITSYGYCWNTIGSPSVSDNKVDNGTCNNSGTYTDSISGLNAATTYYFKAFVINNGVTIYGAEQTFTTLGVKYNVIVPSGTKTCFITGDFVSNLWNPTTRKLTQVDPTHYTITIPEATMSNVYKYLSGPDWIYVEKDASGNEIPNRTFSTNDVVLNWASVFPNTLTVSTQEALVINSSQSTLNGTITNLGDEPVTSYGFCINTTGTPTISDTKLDKGACSLTGAYTYNATGLTPSTLYYVRSFATNSAGTTYGTQVSFTTTSGLGALTTQAVSSILSTTATLIGTLSSLGDSPVTSYGFCVNTIGNPTITDIKLDKGACSATGAYIYSASGLTQSTTYYVRSFATNNAGTAYGDQVSFTTTAWSVASLTTQAVTSVSSTIALLRGNVVILGVIPVTSYGFCINTIGSPTISNTKFDKGACSATGAFTYVAMSLTPNTTYYVRSFATNILGTDYGTQVSFTTASGLGALTTEAVSSIFSTTATLNGTVSSLGDSPVNSYGFCINTTGSPTISDTKLDKGACSSIGTYTYSATGLTPSTTYYVRSFATNNAGTAYGNQVSFTTTSGLSTLTTEAVSSIFSTTATLNGTVSSLGDSPVNSYGFCINTTGSPTISDTKLDKGACSTTGTFTYSASGLTPITTYYVRSYATNSFGTAYGTQVSFATTSGLPVLSTQVATSTSSTTSVLNGLINSLGDNPITSYGFCLNVSGTPTILDTKLDKGICSATGSFSTNASGLIPNTIYYVRSYATTSAGTTYYGNELNFTTISGVTGSLLLQEDFQYTAATDLLGQGGWLLTAAASPTIKVTQASITYPDYPSSGVGNELSLSNTGQDLYNTFTNQTTGTVYSSFIVNVSAANTTGDYFLFLGSNPLASGFYSRVFVKADASGKLAFGILYSSGGTITPTYTDFIYDKNTTYLIVVKYAINGASSNSSLIINPVISTTEPVSGWLTDAQGTATKPSSIGAIGLRQGTASNAPTLKLDGIHIATSWTDLFSTSAPLVGNLTTTQTVTSITAKIARLNGTVTSLGSTSVTSYGFCWNTTGTPTLADSKVDKGICSATGIFIQNISDFTPNTNYFVRSYATNSDGTTYGNEVNFTTPSGLAALSTQATSSVLSTTATLNGTVSSFGESSVTSYGFCMNTIGAPTINDTKLDKGACSATGVYTYNVTGLTPGTTYYVRPYATNSFGTFYGTEVSFATADVPASSNLGGNYYTSQHWTIDKSPYSITTNVNLGDGTKLTIDPGVVVNFAGNYEIMSMGNINAIGTPTDSITFNANQNFCTFIDLKNTKLSNSQLSYLKFMGYKNTPLNGTLTYSTALMTQGTCTDSLLVNNVRIESSAISSVKSVLINNSRINDLYAGASIIKVNNSSLLSSTFGDYNSVNASIQNSSASNIIINGYYYNSNIYVQNSIIKSSNFGSTSATVKNSKLYKCNFSAGSWEYPTIRLDSTILAYTPFSAGSGSSTVTNCIFKNDSTQTVSLNGVTTKSQFIGENNRLGGIGLDAVSGTMTNCLIANNRIGLQTGSLTINNSNFINNTPTVIKNTGTNTIDAKSNFWGVGNTTTSAVKAMIWDYYKDMSLGKVAYDNYLTIPNTDCPISAPVNVQKSAVSGGVNYTWNANPEGDVKGYKVYYGTFDGFKFANSIDVGNVTTYTMPNATLGDNLVVTAYDTQADGKNDIIAGHESWYSDFTFPESAGTIVGATSVCRGETSKVYTVPIIANATSYSWTLPNGASGMSTTNSISVNFGSTSTSGNITVQGHNDFGDGVSSILTINVDTIPQFIYPSLTGLTTVNQGQNSVIYRIYDSGSAKSYVWTLPSGAIGASTTNSITVNFSTSAVSGNICVAPQGNCGIGLPATLAVTVRPLPAAAGTITGSTSVCQGQTSVTYTVPPIANATSYQWTLFSGATFTGSSTTNTITVNYYGSASGSISVKGRNTVGVGASSSLAITVNQPVGYVGMFYGPSSVCQGQTAVTYSVDPIANATSYVWTLPTGVSGTSTTNSITVDFGSSAVAGNISVRGKNDCGDGMDVSYPVTVIQPIGSAGAISGATTVCQGQNNITYTVPAIDNATSYTWTLPSGATGTSTSNSITVNYDRTAVSGNITVKGQNSCGVGSASSLAITVNPLPADAGVITGKTLVCQGENSVTYTVPVIDNATSYKWTLPSGTSGSSTTNSIIVNYSNSAISGTISVKGQNDCGYGIVSTLAITINQLPIITVTDKTVVCGGSVQLNAVVPNYSASALTYLWTPTTGLNDNTIANPTATVTSDITYTVTVGSPGGCTSSANVLVKIVPMSKPSICMVGIHSSNKNMIVWEKPVSTGIESFNIYRETNVTNVYEKIGSVAYDLLSVFIDNTSAPDVQSNNYKISIVDKAGFETEQSNLHKTMHLSINKGLNTTWNLNWEKYEGYTVSTYNIYRGSTANNMVLIGSTSGSNSQYSDISAPLGDVFYQLEVVNPSSCNPTSTVQHVKTSNEYTFESYSSSRSNIASNVSVVTGMENDTNKSFKLYPIPVKNELRIEFEGSANYEVINMVGQVVFNGNLIKNVIIQTSNLKPGIYLVKLNTGKSFEFQKIIKE